MKKHTIDTLINEKALLFAKFLRDERETWTPRIVVTNCSINGAELRGRKNTLKDSWHFELAMRNLLGKRYYGSAGGFSDYSFCKKCLLKAMRRIRKRLDEILAIDERLRQTTSSVLDTLESESKKISGEVNNDWEIIADLIYLVSYLLGYDWLDGRTHRSVIYYQDKAQEQTDWMMIKGRKEYFDTFRQENKRRYILINILNSNNIPHYQIATLLGISLDRVGKILKFIQEYEKEKGERFPTF